MVYFSGFGWSWRPHAENLNIPLGILMVWMGPEPPKPQKTLKYMNSTGLSGIPWNLGKFQWIQHNYLNSMTWEEIGPPKPPILPWEYQRSHHRHRKVTHFNKNH